MSQPKPERPCQSHFRNDADYLDAMEAYEADSDGHLLSRACIDDLWSEACASESLSAIDAFARAIEAKCHASIHLNRRIEMNSHPIETAPTRSLTLNGYQLKAALEFFAPDQDADQLESELRIEWVEARVSTEGEPMEAGMYAWLSDYPEDYIPLDDKPASPVEAAAPQLSPKRIIDAFHKYGTGRLDGFAAAVRELEAECRASSGEGAK